MFKASDNKRKMVITKLKVLSLIYYFQTRATLHEFRVPDPSHEAFQKLKIFEIWRQGRPGVFKVVLWPFYFNMGQNKL